MGIQGLMKLIHDEAPGAIKKQSMDNLTGRKVAIDASMAMYQFLIAVQTSRQNGGAATVLTNESGEVTSHIQGMFNRTIKMLTSGVKPVYVFDGRPPSMKGNELAKRIARREKAEKQLQVAMESDNVGDIEKFSSRLVKVTRQHNEDCKRLLRLMGVPYVDAPCEAEAQCAELAKKGKVYATATEDMDALTFRTPKLLRKMTFSQSKEEKEPIMEIDVEQVLVGFELTYEQFVDLCILCGCDYCTSIKGIGPKTALKLIKQFKSIEGVVAHLKKDKKYVIPLDWNTQKVSKVEFEKAEKEMEAETIAANEKEIETDGVMEQQHLDQSIASSSSSSSVEAVATAATAALDEEEDGLNYEQPEEEEAVIEDDSVVIESVDDTNSNNVNDSDVIIIGDAMLNEEDYITIEPLYAQARQLFLVSDVTKAEDIDIKWGEPNEIELREFLVGQMGFNVDRVNGAIKRLVDAQKKKSQKRLDSFFAPAASSTSSTAVSNALKRKAEEAKGGKGKAANASAKKSTSFSGKKR